MQSNALLSHFAPFGAYLRHRLAQRILELFATRPRTRTWGPTPEGETTELTPPSLCALQYLDQGSAFPTYRERELPRHGHFIRLVPFRRIFGESEEIQHVYDRALRAFYPQCPHRFLVTLERHNMEHFCPFQDIVYLLV